MGIAASLAWVRSTARLILGAFLFLIAASYLALPCLQADGGLFVAAPRASKPIHRPIHGPVSLPAFGAPLLATSVPKAVVSSSAPNTVAQLPAPPSVPPVLPIAPACGEHKLFKPQINFFKAFEIPAFAQTVRFAIVLTVTLGVLGAARFDAVAVLRFKQRWRRIGSLPFASSERPRLPYFSAVRDI